MTAGLGPTPQPAGSPLRIALIASARHSIADPSAGGLEAHTWTLSTALRAHGHEVTVFTVPGSDPALGVVEVPLRSPRISEEALRDPSMVAPPPWCATASTPIAGTPAPAGKTWSGRDASFGRRMHIW
ncbi:glycosyltransferase [Streptomyces sp. NPDC048565]|uniref:glycosyltransferase n=1 Tax=Streptomyces sp. NPDC048565 TaxID=3155266 RepID=UPI00341AC22B